MPETKPKCLRCGIDPCADYNSSSETYCSYGPKMRIVTKGDICIYKRLKPVNPTHDDQGFPMSVPADKLAELAQSSEIPLTLIEIEARRRDHEQKHPFRRDDGYISPYRKD